MRESKDKFLWMFRDGLKAREFLSMNESINPRNLKFLMHLTVIHAYGSPGSFPNSKSPWWHKIHLLQRIEHKTFGSGIRKSLEILKWRRVEKF